MTRMLKTIETKREVGEKSDSKKNLFRDSSENS